MTVMVIQREMRRSGNRAIIHQACWRLRLQLAYPRSWHDGARSLAPLSQQR
jgi:hypothetical protein